MKITAFDDLYSVRLSTGDTIIGGSSGSNAGYIGGDVLGGPGSLSVVGLRNIVSLSSNMGDNTVGTVLTTIQSSPWLVAFAQSSNSSVASNASLRTTGGADAVTALGSVGTNKVLMVGGANYFTLTLTASITIGFTGWAASGSLSEIGVRVTEDGTGGWTPTFTGVTWIGGTTPTHVTTASTTTEYVFWTTDSGATIVGGQVGAGGGSTSPLTTKGDLYTYTTTNARFAVGSNGMLVVADPLETTGLRWTTNPAVGEILTKSSPAIPITFDDLLTNSLGDDLVYGSR